MSTLPPLLWVAGNRCDSVHPDVEPDELYGHFGVSASEGGRHLLARDPLGVHKLFFALDDDGRIDVDNWLHALLRRHPARRVYSAPSSALLEIDTAAHTLRLKAYPELPFDSAPDEEAAATDIARELATTFERLSQAVGNSPVYVTLSGGLDSSTVAAFAATHLPRGQLTAVTLHVDDHRPVSLGTDLHAARLVARQLGLPLLELVVDPESIPELLDDVLLYGQDFRDFNVHCAFVNAAIGRALRDHAGDPRASVFVITGDGANELMSDYDAVELEGRSYYALPRLPRSMLRRFLIRGLDAGDREVGVFAHFGLRCIQPFLLAARAFAAVPASLIDDRTAKAQLARRVLGDRIPKLIFERPKVRAQCGREGEPSGMLAAVVRAGIDQNALSARFAALYGLDGRWLRELIRAGMYRTPRAYEQLS
jgi:asparagine synthetase B (glutamine-hydrolysing)